MQSHVIFGAGLIGCFLGGILTSKGFNTALVCRPRIKQKLSAGLLLTDYLDNRTKVDNLNVIDSDSPDKWELPNQNNADVIWLTVKCTGVERASSDMLPLVGKHTIIMCCQNGLGSDHIVKQAFPENRVLRVMVPFNVAEPSEGHYHRGSEGTLTIETNTASAAFVDELVRQCHGPLMPVSSTVNMQALLWAKLQLNLGNSINALADIPVKAMLEQRAYRKVIAALMDELLKVTEALEISLPKMTALPAKMLPKVLRLPDVLFRLVANKMLQIDPTVRTSMWWDLSSGKTTEIDHLNGAIVSAAKKLRVNTPVNEKIIGLIKDCERASFKAKNREVYSAEALLDAVSERN